MQIDRGDQTLWVAAIHMPWPFPYSHEASTRAVVDSLTQMDGPIVVAGDFNIFPWASSAVRIRQASRTAIAGPVRPTFYLRGMPLLLDHVYAPGGGHVEQRPLFGSDHFGVLAKVSVHP